MRLDEVVFLDVSHVEAAHAEAIRVGGGSAGIRDRNLLESAVFAPRSGYYASVAELGVVLAHGLAKNHPFVDGNKRASLYALLVFLEVNGIVVVLERARWRRVFEGLAAGTVTRDELLEAVTEAMGGDPLALD